MRKSAEEYTPYCFRTESGLLVVFDDGKVHVGSDVINRARTAAPSPFDLMLHPALRRRPTCHSCNHRTECDKMDQHQRFVIPQRANSKPPHHADQKQIKVPWRPSKPCSGIAQDLDDRCTPFDHKNQAVKSWALGDSIRQHGSNRRRYAGSDRLYSHRLQRPEAILPKTLPARARSDPLECAPCDPRFPASCQ